LKFLVSGFLVLVFFSRLLVQPTNHTALWQLKSVQLSTGMSTAASAPKATYLPDETAAQLLRRTRCPPLPTRVALIDELRVGDAVELFGASGSGKTEMLYHIILACIMPKVRNQFADQFFILSCSQLADLTVRSLIRQEYQGFDLQGASSKALVLDLDCRFNLSRLSTILESRIFALMKAQRPDFDGGM
jgi:hypothetical protein